MAAGPAAAHPTHWLSHCCLPAWDHMHGITPHAVLKARTRGFKNGAVDKTLYPLLCLLCVPQTKAFKGNFQSPVTFFTMPLASAVAREVSRVQLAAAGGDPEALAWQPQLVPFPHPQVRAGRMRMRHVTVPAQGVQVLLPWFVWVQAIAGERHRACCCLTAELAAAHKEGSTHDLKPCQATATNRHAHTPTASSLLPAVLLYVLPSFLPAAAAQHRHGWLRAGALHLCGLHVRHGDAGATQLPETAVTDCLSETA